MCTVSFVHTGEKIIITSNRDEQVLRSNALEPRKYIINNKNIFFPKDLKAGGTWYAVDEFSNVIVLLNGADDKPVPKGNYRKSRGLIVLELISANSPIEHWHTIDLDCIESFTLVVFENQRLYLLQWNEYQKLSEEIYAAQPHIWSSATLYSEVVRNKRKEWFNEFMDENPNVNEKQLFLFHRYTENENSENGLVINRDNFLRTLSITQTVIEKRKVDIHYTDLVHEKEFSTTFIKG